MARFRSRQIARVAQETLLKNTCMGKSLKTKLVRQFFITLDFLVPYKPYFSLMISDRSFYSHILRISLYVHVMRVKEQNFNSSQ